MVWKQNEEAVSCCESKFTCTARHKNVSHLSPRTREALDIRVSRLSVGSVTPVVTWIKVTFLGQDQGWVSDCLYECKIYMEWGWIMFENFSRSSLYFL